MFCQSCGTRLEDGTTWCTSCGAGPLRGSTDPASDIGNKVKVSSRDALGVMKRLLVNPVGGLPAAFATLGPDRAMTAGIALCVAYALAVAAGSVMTVSQLERLTGTFLGQAGAELLAKLGGLDASQGIAGFLKIAVKALVLPASIAAVGFGIRKIASASAPVAADVFTAGAALVPWAVATVIAGIIGLGNAEVVLLLYFFATVYLVLMLYAGFTRVGGMSDSAGAPAVPVAILLAAWLCKVVFVALV